MSSWRRERPLAVVTLGLILAICLLTGTGCRRAPAPPQQVAAEPPRATAAESPPAPLPEDRGDIAIAPTPTDASPEIDATGEVVVMEEMGTVHHGAAGGPLRRIGNFMESGPEGCACSRALWSPDGKSILLYTDMSSSDVWFFWDGSRLVRLSRHLQAVYGHTPWHLEWFDAGRIIGCSHEKRLAVAPARPDSDTADDSEHLHPATNVANLREFWQAPDLSYTVSAVRWESDYGSAATGLCVAEPGGKECSQIATSVYPDTGAWGDIGNRVVWRDQDTEQFYVRTGRDHVSVYGRTGENLREYQWGMDGAGPEKWDVVDWPSPGLRHIAVKEVGGALWVLSENSVRRVVERAGKGVDCQWSPDGQWLACWVPGGDGGYQWHLYGVPAHTIVHVPNGRESFPQWEWSPDSRMLAYTGLRKTGDKAMFVLDTMTCSSVEVSGGVRRARDDAELKVHPKAWTADGRHVIYSDAHVKEQGPTERALWIASADGTHRRKLLDLKWQCDVSCGPPPVIAE